MNRVDRRFACMGGQARIRLESDSLPDAVLDEHVRSLRAFFEEFDASMSRFRADSELSILNRDPRERVPASPLLRELVGAARFAGQRSRGLVDATLLDDLETQGYRRSRTGLKPAPLTDALAAAPPRRRARPRKDSALATLDLDHSGNVTRPPGVRLDSGGIGKGMAADMASARLPRRVRFAISCGGDLAIGAPADHPFEIAVLDARTGAEAHRLTVSSGGVATSGIDNRLWRRPDGSYAHHLLDPATGEPAWTGLTSVTALATSALEAEVLAKTALLSGPNAARRLLAGRGGVMQHDGGEIEVVPVYRPVIRLPRPPERVAA
ncbi:MAG: FAD:protein transferase [Thermoleophilaceae bacterium]|nr:FAD:protein transferase [Thermoleophilaceae bacterium]